MNRPPGQLAIRRLLPESAPLARRWASTHCVTAVYGGSSCRWYHGIWQYLAAMHLVSTPWRESEFYLDVLAKRLAGREIESVLVSGTSDYAMLALVHEASLRAGLRMPRCVVNDACPTPLRLNAWYADRHGFAVQTRAGNILDFDISEPFDVVCTHAFLGNFPAERRRALVSHWYRLLKPGGCVVSINRVRPGAPSTIGFTAAQAVAFREKALAALRETGVPVDMDEKSLAEAVDRYTSTYVSHPVSSETELASLFTDCGFQMERFDVDDSRPQSGGPSSSVSGTRVRFVARRPVHGQPASPA